MCLHIIFGCGDDNNVELNEAVIVTDAGVELLCETPRILFGVGEGASLLPTGDPTRHVDAFRVFRDYHRRNGNAQTPWE